MKCKKHKSESLFPFHIHSIIGFNAKVPIVNLTIIEKRPTVAYASGHIVTILDCVNNGTDYLLGHEHDILFIGSAKACKLLATSDEILVNLWERIEKKNGKLDAVLLKSFYDPFVNEPILSMGLSVDGKYLVLASQKHIKLWILHNRNDQPDATHLLPDDFHVGRKIVFCRSSIVSSSFVVTTEKNLLFCRWNVERGILETHSPKPIRGSNHITESAYCSNYCKGVSIARKFALIWSDTPPNKEMKRSNFKNRMEFQFEMKLGFYQLQTVSCCNGFVIISDSSGYVNFFDETMKLCFFYHLHGQIVSSISFTDQENENYESEQRDKDVSCVGHFFVSCTSGRMYKCNLNTKPILLRESPPMFVTCFDLHPQKELLCGGREDGSIFLYDYSTNNYDKCMSLPTELSKQLKIKLEYTATVCLCFSSCGRYIAVGMRNGCLAILNTITFTLSQKVLKVADDDVAIEKVIFSKNNEFIAYRDESCKVGLLRFDSTWKLISKCRIHDIQIVYMSFRESDNELGFVTISEDYEVGDYIIRSAESADEFKLTVVNCSRADYLSVLRSCIKMKRNVMTFPDRFGNDEEAYLTTDEKYKFQIRHIKTLQVLNTFAAPICGKEPITKLCPVFSGNEKAVVFSINNIIGLQHLPIDGNPHKYLAMAGHSRKIVEMKVSHCNEYLFTIAEDDATVYKWKIRMSALVKQYEAGGTTLKPFCNLMPGGVDGEYFKQMQDLFFYIQIKAQKEKSIDIKNIRLSDGIPVDEVIDFMRGIGFFPNLTKIGHIKEDLKCYSNDTTITFENLFKLFANYRPPFGYQRNDLDQTVKYLGYSYTMQSADTEITRERLLEVLTSLAEEMEESDAIKYLNRLDGQDDNGCTSSIRSVYTLSEFMKYILGID